jgi:HD-GYP domain-containing protein (c-di-GMP phosphodiesterase class II)
MKVEEIVSKSDLIDAIRFIEKSKGNYLTSGEIEFKIGQLEKIKGNAFYRIERKGYKCAFLHGGDSHGGKAVIYSDALCKAFGFPDEKRLVVDFATEWHDIGKTQLPEEILNKPGELTKEEWVIIKTHSAKSEELLKPLNYPAKIARYHHRRVDGTGYPEILKGDEVPLGSRIVAVSEAYRIMTNYRPYKIKDVSPEEIRKTVDRRKYVLPVEIALEELKNNAGTQFDADVVDCFVKIIREGKIGKY